MATTALRCSSSNIDGSMRDDLKLKSTANLYRQILTKEVAKAILEEASVYAAKVELPPQESSSVKREAVGKKPIGAKANATGALGAWKLTTKVLFSFFFFMSHIIIIIFFFSCSDNKILFFLFFFFLLVKCSQTENSRSRHRKNHVRIVTAGSNHLLVHHLLLSLSSKTTCSLEERAVVVHKCLAMFLHQSHLQTSEWN